MKFARVNIISATSLHHPQTMLLTSKCYRNSTSFINRFYIKTSSIDIYCENFRARPLVEQVHQSDGTSWPLRYNKVLMNMYIFPKTSKITKKNAPLISSKYNMILCYSHALQMATLSAALFLTMFLLLFKCYRKPANNLQRIYSDYQKNISKGM